MTKIMTLTAEQKARFPEFVEKWTKIGLCTEPADRSKAEQALRGLYALAKLREPRVIWCPCPISAALSTLVYATLVAKRIIPGAGDINRERAVGTAVDTAVGTAVDTAVGTAVGTAVDTAVGTAVDTAVDTAVGTAVDTAVRTAVRTAVGTAVDTAVGTAVDTAVYNAVYWPYGGSLWAGYAAWADYFNEALAISIDRNYLDLVESCGYYWMLDGLVFASERPREINLDANGRLHSEAGPSISYPSGWGLHHIHGVRVPEWIVSNPQDITASLIDAEENAEVRRVMIEKYGTARYMADSGAIMVDSRPADFPMVGLRGARLWRKDVPDDEPIVMIEVNNSTPEPDGSIKIYHLRVDPDAYAGMAAQDCLAAIASTWRETTNGPLVFSDYRDYAPLVES